MSIRPVGMTLERALQIATAALPEPADPDQMMSDVVRLHGEGLMDTQIAEQLGIARYTVGQLRKRAGLDSNFTAARRGSTCKHGHERTPENTYTDPRGAARCRPCNTRTARFFNKEADNA